MSERATFLGYLKRNPLFVVALVLLAIISTFVIDSIVPDIPIRNLIHPVAGAILSIPIVIL